MTVMLIQMLSTNWYTCVEACVHEFLFTCLLKLAGYMCNLSYSCIDMHIDKDIGLSTDTCVDMCVRVYRHVGRCSLPRSKAASTICSLRGPRKFSMMQGVSTNIVHTR